MAVVYVSFYLVVITIVLYGIALWGFVVAEQTRFADDIVKRNLLEARLVLIGVHSILLVNIVIKSLSHLFRPHHPVYGIFSVGFMFVFAALVCVYLISSISLITTVILLLSWSFALSVVIDLDGYRH
jgi:hypothetical protein